MASRLLVYLCSEGLDLVFQAALLPWAFWYLVHTNYLEGHWGRAVISYGTLCSMQALGRFLGRACSPQVVSSSDVTMRTRQVFGMLLLGGVSIMLCMTNRYFLMLLAYFGAGFAGANLVGACSPNYRLNAGLSLGGDFDSALGSNSVSGVAAMRSAGLFVGTGTFGGSGGGSSGSGGAGGVSSSVGVGGSGSWGQGDTDASSRNAIIIFMFVTLTSGLLYSEGGNASQHSAFGPCVILAALCLLAASLYLSTNKIAYKQLGWTFALCLCCFEKNESAGSSSKPRTPFAARCWSTVLALLSYLPKESKERRRADAEEEQMSLLSTPIKSAGEGIGDDGDASEVDLRLPVPDSFLTLCNGNAAQAAKTFAATLRWRRENNVDSLMSVPQADFYQILDMYPHAIHGTSLDDCTVLYEVLGKARPKDLSAAGITPLRLVWHFNLRNEFVLRRLPALARGRVGDLEPYSVPHKMMTVLDVKGINVSDITTDVMSFIRASGEIMDAHFPGVVQRLVICNAPHWFYSVWTFLARVLPDSVRKKITIIHDTAGLDKFIHPSQRPVEYGGTDKPLGQSAEHLSFLRIAEGWVADGYVFPSSSSSSSSAEATVSAVSQVAAAAGVGPATSQPVARRLLDDDDSGSERDGSDREDEGEDRANMSIDASSSHPPQSSSHSSSSSSSANNSGGGGIFGWVRSRLSKAPDAHLGEKNRFHFDEASGKWTLDPVDETGEGEGEGDESWDAEAQEPLEGAASSSSSSSSAFRDAGRTPTKADHHTSVSPPRRFSELDRPRGRDGSAFKMTPAQLEEHGLVLAIQAAHLAATMGRKDGGSHSHGHHRAHYAFVGADPEGGSSFPLSALGSVSRDGGDEFGGGGVGFGNRKHSDSESSHGLSVLGVNDGHERPSTHVLMLVTGLYVVACLLQAGLVAMIPAWLVVPASLGGEGFLVKDLCIVLSAAGLVALHAHIFLRPRIFRVAQASPLRALRTGAGSLAIACFIMPTLREFLWLPSQSLLAIPLPAVLIVWTGWSPLFSLLSLVLPFLFSPLSHIPSLSLSLALSISPSHLNSQCGRPLWLVSQRDACSPWPSRQPPPAPRPSSRP